MGRATRATSNASVSSTARTNQELGSMYDYLAKIILLGPSGAGKSCILHRFVHANWRILSSQTIGVEFASKIVSIGAPGSARRTRIKLQLWDTAGTERFRSVSRSYYRGAAGAILVYDVASWPSFEGLRTFLEDARALASRELVVVLAGNKCDVDGGGAGPADSLRVESAGNGPGGSTYGSYASYASYAPSHDQDADANAPTPSSQSSMRSGLHHNSYTVAPEGREVPPETASRWAGEHGIPVAVEVSALSGDNVDELFERLARTILTKIELGEIDPDDPSSGIQYGDVGGGWGGTDDDSVKSGRGGDEGVRRRRRGKKGGGGLQLGNVFSLPGSSRRRTCC